MLLTKGPSGDPPFAWVAASERRRASGALLQRLQVALDHGAMADLQSACVDGLAPLKASLRALLHYHLGPVPLRTRQVWQGVQQLSPRTPPPIHEPTRRP